MNGQRCFTGGHSTETLTALEDAHEARFKRYLVTLATSNRLYAAWLIHGGRPATFPRFTRTPKKNAASTLQGLAA